MLVSPNRLTGDPVSAKRHAEDIDKFVTYWQAPGWRESADSQTFWGDFFRNVLQVENPTPDLSFEFPVRTQRIDLLIKKYRTLIEMKSSGFDLDHEFERRVRKVREKKAKEQLNLHDLLPEDESLTPNDAEYEIYRLTAYQQAKMYADNLPFDLKPRWIITCNFHEFRIYDMNKSKPEKEYDTIFLQDLKDKCGLFSFLTTPDSSEIRKEQALSLKAASLVGVLRDHLSKRYKNIEKDEREQHFLNVLLTRLVFLLFAEDARILQAKDSFSKYMKDVPAKLWATTLTDLFKVLDTPEGERPPYLNQELASFPYINGGLFTETIEIPQFLEEDCLIVLNQMGAGFNWSDISPVIFGAAYESCLNSQTQRENGMHFTSVECIDRVLKPLFVDALVQELQDAENKTLELERIYALRALHKKISNIKVLDPACGSGNFIVRTYQHLRLIENRIIESLRSEPEKLLLDDDLRIKVSIGQLHGIELQDFACSVAKTAIWITECQMALKTSEVLGSWQSFLPLKNYDNIRNANALRIDWNEVLPADKCSYIIGNPPFVGASLCSNQQKNEVVDLFGKIKLSNSLDYVSGWYYKAAEYIKGTDIRCAFVSTNSITQGEMVAPIWGTLMDRFDIHINFAHKTFRWNSEATGQAHVFVIIVGFSSAQNDKAKLLFEYATPDSYPIVRTANNINPYLIDAPDVLVQSRGKPISGVLPLLYGNKPTDDGNLILTSDERSAILGKHPEASGCIRKYVGAKEFLNGGDRYCLWLDESNSDVWEKCPLIVEKVNKVKEFRLRSSAKPTRDKASSPEKFFFISHNNNPYLVLPRHSSERREYIPIGFMPSSVIASDAVSVVQNATAYHFGILTSQFHNAWMRVVAGRLKSDYRYSAGIVYNNFPWPDPTPEQKDHIERRAQLVLDVREQHPDKSLADLYDPDKMPESLKNAHELLDAAVEAAYGVDFDGDEEKIVAHLFKLYAEMTEGE